MMYDNKYWYEYKDILAGALLGILIGAIFTKNKLIGAIIGGLAGGAIGYTYYENDKNKIGSAIGILIMAFLGYKVLDDENLFKKKIFVSFDYDNDKRYKYLLEAWDANPNLEFSFADTTPDEIDSKNIDRIKAVLTTKTNNATHTLVIVGKDANKLHKDHKLIGFRNWINFEIHQSKLNSNKIVAVKIDKTYESPEELLNAGASWAMSFEQDTIIKAINNT